MEVTYILTKDWAIYSTKCMQSDYFRTRKFRVVLLKEISVIRMVKYQTYFFDVQLSRNVILIGKIP